MPFYVVHVPYYGFVIVWITSIIFFVTSSLLFKKYSEKKAMPTKYLGLSLFSFGIGSFLMGLLLFIDNFGLRIKPGYPNAYIGFVFDQVYQGSFGQSIFLPAGNKQPGFALNAGVHIPDFIVIFGIQFILECIF